ncbi:MAG TPA: GxxExxY protein [Candidatus Binatia bacterium]
MSNTPTPSIRFSSSPFPTRPNGNICGTTARGCITSNRKSDFHRKERKGRKKEMTDQKINALCDRVRQTAYEIHLYLGHGHLEKVYENALTHRFAKTRSGGKATISAQCV